MKIDPNRPRGRKLFKNDFDVDSPLPENPKGIKRLSDTEKNDYH